MSARAQKGDKKLADKRKAMKPTSHRRRQ